MENGWEKKMQALAGRISGKFIVKATVQPSDAVKKNAISFASWKICCVEQYTNGCEDSKNEAMSESRIENGLRIFSFSSAPLPLYIVLHSHKVEFSELAYLCSQLLVSYFFIEKVFFCSN